MAARLNARHDEEARKKIQTSQLINRLHSNAMGEVDMTPAQVQSAKILLDKSLPNLASVTVGGDTDNPLQMTIEHTFKSDI
jgi:hypothetical protein